MTGAFVHVDICGGPNQGTGTTMCLSIGGQPAQAGQKVLAVGSTLYIVEGNSTTLPNGNPMTPQNTHVCEVSLGNVGTGAPCTPSGGGGSTSGGFSIQNAYTGGCVWAPQPIQPIGPPQAPNTKNNNPNITRANISGFKGDDNEMRRMQREFE